MWSVHASKHTSIHTHACNQVTLVWGSLRLAPISITYIAVMYYAEYEYVNALVLNLLTGVAPS